MMKTRFFCFLAAVLAFTSVARADETATAPSHETTALLAAITTADPANAETRYRRNEWGKVVEVRLGPALLKPEVLGHLRKAGELEALTIGCSTVPVGKELTPALAELHQLDSLRMLGCGADALPGVPARGLGRLRSLYIGYQKITPAIARAIARLPRLEELDLHALHGLTAENLAPLGACPKLVSLDLSSSDAGDDLVETLLKLKGTLKALNLRNAKFSEAALQRLREGGLTVRTR